MRYRELVNSIKTEGVSGTYLLEGADGYFLNHAEKAIKDACLDIPDLDFSSYEGSDLKNAEAFSELSAALNNLPFGSKKRVVKISDFYPSDDSYKKYLGDIFESIPDTSVLIIKNNGDKKSKLAQKKNIKFVDCSSDKIENVSRWVLATLKKNGVPCDPDAANAVAQYCLCDMSRVEIEVEKLLDSQISNITKDVVDTYVYKDTDYKLYEMGNYIAVKNYGKFCTVMNDLRIKGMDDGTILSVLLSFFNDMITVSSSRKSDEELASAIGRNKYGVSMMRSQASGFKKSDLEYYSKKLYSLIADDRNGFLSGESALQCAVAEIFFNSSD